MVPTQLRSNGMAVATDSGPLLSGQWNAPGFDYSGFTELTATSRYESSDIEGEEEDYEEDFDEDEEEEPKEEPKEGNGVHGKCSNLGLLHSPPSLDSCQFGQSP
jgi:hypothetical protein